MKSLLFLIIVFSGFVCSAQQYSLSYYDTSQVDASLLIGFWESADSNKYRIEFEDIKYAVRLKADVGVNGGYEFWKDSLNRVTTNGFVAAWPPYNCNLKFISHDTLEVATSHFMSDFIKSKYVRVKETLKK